MANTACTYVYPEQALGVPSDPVSLTFALRRALKRLGLRGHRRDAIPVHQDGLPHSATLGNAVDGVEALGAHWERVARVGGESELAFTRCLAVAFQASRLELFFGVQAGAEIVHGGVAERNVEHQRQDLFGRVWMHADGVPCVTPEHPPQQLFSQHHIRLQVHGAHGAAQIKVRETNLCGRSEYGSRGRWACA